MHTRSLLLLSVLASVGIASPGFAENLEHTQKLLSTKECVKCDLTRAGLVFADLNGANLRGANLAGANLSQAKLQGADLRGANLAGASLNGTVLTDAKLDGANLTGADLRGAYLAGVSWQNAVVENAFLQGAIGLPTTVGKLEDFYRWAIEAERRKDYVAAITNFTKVIERQPDFAPAYIGRSAARLQGGDIAGAVSDAKQAEKLFAAQGDTENALIANKLALMIETPPETKLRPAKPNFGSLLTGVLGGALQLFMSRFPMPFF